MHIDAEPHLVPFVFGVRRFHIKNQMVYFLVN